MVVSEKHNATVRSMIGPNTRPQVIFTPESILAPLRELWGRPIALDPCGSRDRAEPLAERTLYEADNGLSHEWTDRTFINPPFRYLKDWLAHARTRATGRRCVLSPARTHRVWWIDAARDADTVLWLRPVTFVGYSQQYPVPVALLFWGSGEEEVERCFDKKLGRCL